MRSRDRTGNSFEEEVETLYGFLMRQENVTIERRTIEVGPDGGRECDIILTAHVGDITIRTLIECKDYSSPVSYIHVDAMVSRLDDLGFNKGIIVSRSGFQSGPGRKAKRKGIDLYTFGSLKDSYNQFGLEVPILHHRLNIEEFSITFDAHPDIRPPLAELDIDEEAPDSLTKQLFITGTLLDPNQCFGHLVGHVDVSPRLNMIGKMAGLHHRSLSENDGHYSIMTNIELFVRSTSETFYGHAHNLDTARFRRSETDGRFEVFISATDLLNCDLTLTKYKDPNEIPEYLRPAEQTATFHFPNEITREGLFEIKDVLDAHESRYGGLKRPEGKWCLVYSRPSMRSNL